MNSSNGPRIEYKAWVNMRLRCYEPETPSYKNYGGRGVRVYIRWVYSYKEFFDYLGPRPGCEYSLDRIDCNGHYVPGNVRWATIDVQSSNRNPRGKNGESPPKVPCCETHEVFKGDLSAVPTQVSGLDGLSEEELSKIPSLERCRRFFGFTQSHMAKIMVVDIRSYQRWEAGDRGVPKYVDEIIQMMNQMDAIWPELPKKAREALMGSVSKIAMMRKNQ